MKIHPVCGTDDEAMTQEVVVRFPLFPQFFYCCRCTFTDPKPPSPPYVQCVPVLRSRNGGVGGGGGGRVGGSCSEVSDGGGSEDEVVKG